ncbi:MAG: response regulator transcription factor [Syntrophorhabdales bacterium]|jgi:DNA-binding NarL/FixJ family response regulator
MNKIKVLLADDHTILREGIKSLLESRDNITVVAEVSNGRDAVQKTKDLRPDIVIMDISMPILNGVEATRQIMQECPRCKILVLTMHEDLEPVRQTLRAGAAGYLMKKSAASELFEAIEAVCRGEAFFSPSVSKMLLEDYVEVLGDGVEVLSPREKEILQLVAEGYANREIADLLCISVKTVEGHKKTIKMKLGVRDQVDLIKYAIQKGIISLSKI